MNWLEQQQQFKQAVEHGGQGLIETLKPGTEHLPASLGLKIYRDAFFLRMRSYLEEDFPSTFSHWKESERRAIVRAYMLKHPSQSPTAADFGANFATYLAQRKWPKELSFLPDMAALEWALVRARNATNVEQLGFERIGTAQESDWANACFAFDPGMKLLESEWPLDELYEDGKAPARKGSYFFLVYRDQGEPAFRPLENAEREWLEALATGISIGALCEKAGSSPDAETFADWVKSGLLVAIHWA